MAKVRVVLDTRNLKNDGTYPLKLSVTNGSTFFIGLDMSVKKEQFDGYLVIDHPKKSVYNSVIKSKLNRTEEIIKDLFISGRLKKLTNDRLKNLIINDSPDDAKNSVSVNDHFCNFFAMCKAQKTKELYDSTRQKINAFHPDLTFEEITYSWLRSFEMYLSKTNGINARAIHLRNIRAVFNDAINNDLVSLNSYPFRKFSIKKEATQKKYLTAEQIKIFRDFEVQEHHKKYRDIAMLSFYLIGINLVDLLNLKPDDLQNGRIEYKRAKTGRLYSIEVLPEAMELINRYKGEKYLINVLDRYKNYKDFTARINENLKEIGGLDWIKNKSGTKNNKKQINPLFPDLTVYHFRRSWATIAASLDIPKETISAALGHEIGSRVTNLYISFDLKKVDKANRKVLKCLNSLA